MSQSTMVHVKITESNGKISVRSPYSSRFIEAARSLGGKWADGVWIFDARHETAVRAACVDAYGTDGSPVPTVTVHMMLFSNQSYGDQISWGGREIVRKRGRDDAPRTGYGVALIDGKFRSTGGSRRNPSIELATPTATLEILDVPRVIADRMVDKDPDAYHIVDDGDPADDLTPAEYSLVDALSMLPRDRLDLVLAELVDRVGYDTPASIEDAGAGGGVAGGPAWDQAVQAPLF